MTHEGISTRALILQRNPHDRRSAQPGLQPPYWNAEGLVLIDRRENSERRAPGPQQCNVAGERFAESDDITGNMAIALAAEPQAFTQRRRVAA
jgi:hypothetical protein